MSEQNGTSAADKPATSAKASAATSVAASAASCALPAYGLNSFFSRWGVFLAGGVVALAALMAYHNSFSGPFILDDQMAIIGEPSIRHLATALSPSASSPANERLVINLTFALNYAFGGMNVWGYHAINLLIHALAGLVLFGVVRRTLASRLAARRSEISDLRFEISADATPLALAVAAIWTVHPVQTEAVTYISQRAESLMGLFYLLTLYCFVRSTGETGERQQARGERSDGRQSRVESGHSVFRSSASSLWSLASVLSCLLGAMTKEIIMTAPVMVLLYDRTFGAGSFREACRLRWRYYLGLACTWLLLAYLMIGLGQRNVGFDQGVTWWSYALTSCRSVALYCKLAVWPHPLIFDYGINFIRHAAEAAPYALTLAALLAGTAIALWRWPVIGFAGAWFFVILAPTSSVVPVALQPMAESRMYLSLAAVVALGVLGLYAWIGRRSLMVCAAAAVGLGWLTVQRNQDYRSELAIWSDTLAKRPDSERAHTGVGTILLKTPGRLPDAMTEFQTALRINPDYAEAHKGLGDAFLQMPDQLPNAVAEYQAALRISPDYVELHNNLGIALAREGHLDEAILQLREIVRIDPEDAESHYNLGTAFFQSDQLMAALGEYKIAAQLKPEHAETHYNLGNTLARLNRFPEAVEQYEQALRFKPDYEDARENLEQARKDLAQQMAGSNR